MNCNVIKFRLLTYEFNSFYLKINNQIYYYSKIKNIEFKKGTFLSNPHYIFYYNNKKIEMYFDKKIQRKAALKLALFDEMMQEWIYEKYNNRLTDNKIMSLKKSMRKKEDIAEALDDPIIMRRINITVPAGREEEIKRVLSEYLKNNPNPVT